MARLACVGAGFFQGRAGFSQFLDGVQLPGKVAEPDAATHLGRRAGAYPEEAEVVAVTGARKPQEGRVGARFAGDDFHPEDLGINALGPVKFGDEEYGMVQPDG